MKYYAANAAESCSLSQPKACAVRNEMMAIPAWAITCVEKLYSPVSPEG